MESKEAENVRMLNEKNLFLKRFEKSLQRVQEVLQILESQEELISKLNQSNTNNNQLLIAKNYDALLRELESECHVKLASEEELKKLVREDGKNRQEKFNLESKNKVQEEEIKKLKEDIKKLTPLINHFTEKIKKLEAEKTEILKKGEKKPAEQKGDKLTEIKHLIDQYISEVESNLKSVGGLSEEEMNGLIQSELKGILGYIPKSIANKNK